MKKLRYRTHNTAYYEWIRKKTSGCRRILDVGCGDGALASYLADGSKEIMGIDIDKSCIGRANVANHDAGAEFICCDFSDYNPEKTFDAVIFVASIHHMDMKSAIEKAKSLLSPGGLILIVGVANPDSIPDYIVEALRVIPSKVVSILRRMKSGEELNIPVSYDFPGMSGVRAAVNDLLPGAAIRYRLHYRYLVEWRRPD